SLGEMQVKTIELINASKKEICIFTNVFYWFEHVKEAMKEAISRNVKIRVLMNADDETSKLYAKELREIGVKVKEIANETVLARGTLVDKEQVVFVIWVSPVKQEKYVYRPHFSSNSGIIEIFSNNFEYLWGKS
ncbi:MAG: phospholipase D-like domain-containing protein, partial [Candidatus Heimdallarchaeaceae archaeon]